jgi:hypothetical protein
MQLKKDRVKLKLIFFILRVKVNNNVLEVVFLNFLITLILLYVYRYHTLPLLYCDQYFPFTITFSIFLAYILLFLQ